MGKRSCERATGMTYEERCANPRGNDKTPSVEDVVKIMNKYIKLERHIRKHHNIKGSNKNVL